MTTLEHVSVEPLPSVYRSSSRTGDICEKGEGDEEVGVAVTTDEEVAVAVAVAVEEDKEGEVGLTDGLKDTHENAGQGVEPGRSRETLRSHSHSRTGSGSNSRSQSSVRVDMGVSSAATSWMQVEDRPSGEGREEVCRTSVDRVGEDKMGVGREQEGGESGERTGTEVRTLLHSRPGTGVEARDGSKKEEVLVMQEEDIGEGWHPLRYDGKVPLQDVDQVEGEAEGEEDVGAAHTENNRGDDRTVGTSEKERWRTFGSSGRNSRHLRLEFRTPSSPQPWDDVDAPTDNNETYASDYYSTLNSKKFETLQKSRRRPLIPHSTYYFGPPPPGSAYGTPPVGQIGVHHPREIVRIERDYTGGELVQFSPVFPLELEGRITPTQFHQTINDINEILISAHSIQHACFDNCLAVITLQLSSIFTTSHYTKEMRRLKGKIGEQNTRLYNPVGLNILWPRNVAFLFLEIEYY